MISVESLLYKIDFKLNKLSSERGQSIPLEDKIIALNEAQIRLIKKKVGLNNLYKSGFDSFKVRYEDLQNLVVESEKVKLSKDRGVIPTYSFNVKDLQEKYYLPVDVYVIADRGTCKNRIVNANTFTRHDSVQYLLNNPDTKPSFLWQETIATMSRDKVIIYSDDFTIKEGYFSYLRYPQKIDYEGYIHLDGTPSVKSDCELEEYLEDELLELTIMELGYNTDNNNAAQAAHFKSQNSE